MFGTIEIHVGPRNDHWVVLPNGAKIPGSITKQYLTYNKVAPGCYELHLTLVTDSIRIVDHTIRASASEGMQGWS